MTPGIYRSRGAALTARAHMQFWMGLTLFCGFFFLAGLLLTVKDMFNLRPILLPEKVENDFMPIHGMKYTDRGGTQNENNDRTGREMPARDDSRKIYHV